MKTKTKIVAILDRSGSMSSCKHATITGFDEFINGQKELDGEAFLTLAQFDDQYEIVYDNTNIQHVSSISRFYQPRGMTALLDAIGRTIDNVKDDDNFDRVLCVIITDGMENASREYNRRSVKSLVTKKEKSNWEFVFLGANMDAVAEGMSFGMKGGSAATYNVNNIEKVMQHVNKTASKYRSASLTEIDDWKSGKIGVFSAEDRTDFVD